MTHRFFYCLTCGDVEEGVATGLACSCRGDGNVTSGDLTQAEYDEWQEYKETHGVDWLAFRKILLSRPKKGR